MLDITELMPEAIAQAEQQEQRAAEAINALRELYGDYCGTGRAKRFVTQDPDMLDMRDTALALSEHDCSVLIYGESGTGKEIIARILHGDRSVKAKDLTGKLFVSVNCAGIVDTLFESLMFGHEAGAFTGASRSSIGVFRSAAGGTVFLDEIGELPLSQQAKLLRALEPRANGKRYVTPVGSTEDHEINCRIIYATHKPLRKMTREGLFREDLYYRIATAKLHTKPLRERRDDVPLITNSILGRHKWKLKEGLLETIPNWVIESTGNVRELFNAIFHAQEFGVWPDEPTDW